MTPSMKCVTDWQRFHQTWCGMMTSRRRTTSSRLMNCLRSAVIFLQQKALIKHYFCLFHTVLHDDGDMWLLSLSGSESGWPHWIFSPSTAYCEGLLYDRWVSDTPHLAQILILLQKCHFSGRKEI